MCKEYDKFGIDFYNNYWTRISDKQIEDIVKASYDQFPCGSFDDDPKCGDPDCKCKNK